jgi:transcriptional regulator GlxA family with amidase domain
MCKDPAMAVHRIAVLALDNVIGFDLGTAPQVFGSARDSDGRTLYEVRVCTPGGRAIRSAAGFQVLPDHGLEALEWANTVVVPGVQFTDFARAGDVDTPTTDALLGAAARGARIMSICTGAFVLAAAGLLEGRRATTHWLYAGRFAARFPKVNLDPSVLFVDEGMVLTSAGVGAGVDLCLHVIRRDHGAVVANRAARRCVMPPWRSGGQAQFIEQQVSASAPSATARARTWAMDHLDEPLELAALAALSRMSVRTFTRHFRSEIGTSPGKWISTQRIERARHLLETTDLPVDQIATQAGFGTGAALRMQMARSVGVAPSAYRQTFRAAG